MDCPEEFKQMMEIDSDDGESENISETFICCVCRDLLYKPLVLGCGHVSCFWCVHRSMDRRQKSRCPICRNQYHHFPYVCQTLHFLLLKMYPSAYKRREKQTLGEEMKWGWFSPQIDAAASQSQCEETQIMPADASLTKPVNLSTTKTGETLETVELAESTLVHQGSGSLNYQLHREDIVATGVRSLNSNDPKQINCNGIYSQVSVGDVLCASCKCMLFRPVVLNCGHVFCICCIVQTANEMLKCEVCQCPHPYEFPKVCLEFDHFLEEQFPTEYKLRKDNSQTKQEQLSGSSGACSKSFGNTQSSGENPLPWSDGTSAVHNGVGCDSCGIYPIVGDRYKCKDCVELAGYDLCKDCYTSRSKLTGRFNQQHTSDHKFEVVTRTSNAIEVLMEQIHDVSAIVAALRDGNRSNLRNVNVDHLSVFEEIIEDAGDDVDASPPLSERVENESENEGSHERLL